MRTRDQIQTDLTGARQKRDELRDELERIHVTAGTEDLSSGQAERWTNIKAGATKAVAQVERLEEEMREDLVVLRRDREREGLRVSRAAWLLGPTIREYRELEAGTRWPDADACDRIHELFGWLRSFAPKSTRR